MQYSKEYNIFIPSVFDIQQDFWIYKMHPNFQQFFVKYILVVYWSQSKMLTITKMLS